MLKTGISMFDILQNPSIFDHYRRRSEDTKLTCVNNMHLVWKSDGKMIQMHQCQINV
jgi:hypothetical protein